MKKENAIASPPDGDAEKTPDTIRFSEPTEKSDAATPATEESTAHADESEAIPEDKPDNSDSETITLAEERNAELVATASPDGSLTLTAAAMEGFIPADEADRIAREAYIRGRNEAIEARWGEIRPEAYTDAAEPSDAPDSLADIFTLRRSVWN